MNYIAFLRGVNVKGTSMKMAEVCTVFEKAGVKNAISVLATGNIIFKSEKSAEDLKTILEKALSKHFDYDAFLFIKSGEEVKQIFENNPFETSSEKHNYVFVSNNGFEKTLLEEFEKVENKDGEQAKILDGTFYWQVEKGNTLHSDFGKILGKKAMKNQFTSRNINTFEKIIKKL